MAYLKGINLSGSTEITGSQAEFIQITGSSITGSFTGSFSATEIVASNLTVSGSTQFGSSFSDTHQFTGSVYISGSLTSDLIGTSSFSTTASYITGSNVDGLVESASLALTASYVTASNVDGLPEGFPYTGSAVISGSLTVTGSIYSDSTIFATSSYALTASYVTGSNVDGLVESASLALTASYITASNVDGLPDGFPYTGSAVISGSLIVTGSIYSDSTIFATASHAISASYASLAQTSSYIAGANVDGTVTSASYAPNTGVTSITAGSGIIIDQSTGNVTISTDTIVGGSIITGSFSNNTSISVTHNFGSTNIIVAVYDGSGNEIIPATLILNNTNKVTATFASPQSGTVVVIEAQSGEFASGSFSNTGSFTLNHSLGTQDLNVVAYDSNDVQFYPDIDILDSSNVKATFAASSSGALLAIVREGTVSSSFSNTVDTTITHNLSSSAVIASVYDASYNKIIPSSVSIVDTSSINLTFASTSSGNVVIVGGPIDATEAEIATTYNQAISGATNYTVTHNLNAEWPLVQVYDSASRSQVREYTVTSINTSNISVVFTSSFNGFIIINS